VADPIPIALYRQALDDAGATLRKSPWVIAVPMAALGLSSFFDWLLAPLLNAGLIVAAPIKAALWSAVLYVWRRVLLEGSADRAQLEAELVARARNLSSLWAPLLFGSIVFLTLALGGALAALLVLALVATPVLEVLLLGSARGLTGFIKAHAVAWAAPQVVLTTVAIAAWLVPTLLASALNRWAGEVTAALVGGPLVMGLWLWRGQAFLLLDEPPRRAAPPAASAPARPPTKRKGPAAK